MKKLIISLLAITLLFTACSSNPQTESEIGGDSFLTTVSSKNFQSEKSSEELEEEIKKLYVENNIMMYASEETFNFEKDNYRVTAYSFTNPDYSHGFYIICRFKDDKLIGYIQPDKAVLELAYNDDDTLSFSMPLEFKSNDDLSHIDINSIYSTANSFLINFDDGTFEYVKNNVETDLTYLGSLSLSDCIETLKQDFLYPYASVGLIGGDSNEVDLATKIINFYAYFHNGIQDEGVDSEGREFSYMPREDVMEFLREHFYNLDRYAFEYNELYSKEKDAFRIYDEVSEPYPYNITIDSYDMMYSLMIIDYTITDDNDNILTKETAYYPMVNNRYVFNFCTEIAEYEENDKPKERYTLSLGEGEGGGDSWMHDVILTDNDTGKTKNLGREHFTDAISDYGFFSNGDVYVMNYTGLTVFDKNMDNPNPVFTTKTNFPCTLREETINEQGEERYLLAIRRDPVTFEYVVIYCQFVSDEDYYKIHINDFQMCCNYRIGILDKTGKLIRSWDTGVPVMFTVFGFENTFMKKVDDNEYEMFVKYKNELRLSGRFNTEKETYVPIKEFKLS